MSKLCPDCKRPTRREVGDRCIIRGGDRCIRTERDRLKFELEALTNAAAGALGFLPRNEPGARMAAERIERVLGEIGVALPAPARPIVVGSKWRDSATESEFTVKRVARGKVTYLTPKDECWAFPEYTWAEAVFRNSFVWVSDPEPASEPRAIVEGSVWRNKRYGYLRTVTRIALDEVHFSEEGGYTDIWGSVDHFKSAHTWVSDPPATSDGREATS